LVDRRGNQVKRDKTSDVWAIDSHQLNKVDLNPGAAPGVVDVTPAGTGTVVDDVSLGVTDPFMKTMPCVVDVTPAGTATVVDDVSLGVTDPFMKTMPSPGFSVMLLMFFPVSTLPGVAATIVIVWFIMT
jgi:hypothetical protein